MNVRSAKVSDAKTINALISNYAEHDKMLFRSLADIYEKIQSFVVAEQDGNVIGCCCLQVIWSDLAEITSLAVEESKKGIGIGTALVQAAVEKAKKIGLKRLFALTMEPVFFEKIGFKRIDMDQLPMKVWSDCARCPKQDNCDEIAVVKDLPI
ncbi:MAG: N-acetyltransferase [Phycisphaerae bacterium]